MCSEIIKKAKELNYIVQGPKRMPNKILRITTRKTPCGEGSDTWDRFQLRIHKRVLDIHCPLSKIKAITELKTPPDINFTVNVW